MGIVLATSMRWERLCMSMHPCILDFCLHCLLTRPFGECMGSFMHLWIIMASSIRWECLCMQCLVQKPLKKHFLATLNQPAMKTIFLSFVLSLENMCWSTYCFYDHFSHFSATNLKYQYFTLPKSRNQVGHHLAKFWGRGPKFCIQSHFMYVVRGIWWILSRTSFKALKWVYDKYAHYKSVGSNVSIWRVEISSEITGHCVPQFSPFWVSIGSTVLVKKDRFLND